MERYLSYNNNELYVILKNQKNYYLIELMEYNLFLLKNYGDLIGDDIINIYVSKMNKILKSLDLNQLHGNTDTQKLLLNIIISYNIINKKVIVNDIFYDSEVMKNFCKKMKLYFKNKRNIDTIEYFESILDTEKVNNKDTNVEIPEDYLDPITNELINDVIILPSSKKKMDLDVIKKHLLYHNFDPFNREFLSLEILEKYNKKEDIKKECDDFMNNLNEWKIKFL